ncbi:hypothetical protein Vretimale_10836 [Volvox reticuliferus]|uniref:BZIP domain-containing protein n=1 Tax=Volvox reticuliferus TaxID=1737510 RepID=A0A8J4CKQ3_9CHLO|nr:hypothetical protein Vretifemale_13549 [Volvox reticuliferus]GIM06551.1 hypothetical protein Vretimale_10836 [Volvox reticuliferus]
MSGQPLQGAQQLRGAMPADAKQPFATMWPSYYALGGGVNPAVASFSAQQVAAAPDSSQADDAQKREREQRILKRKQANRESAKRSKLKRQQAERELQEHARRVDDERDILSAQLAAAQQRYVDAQAKHLDLRRKIQAYVDNPSNGGTAGSCWPSG